MGALTFGPARKPTPDSGRIFPAPLSRRTCPTSITRTPRGCLPRCPGTVRGCSGTTTGRARVFRGATSTARRSRRATGGHHETVRGVRDGRVGGAARRDGGLGRAPDRAAEGLSPQRLAGGLDREPARVRGGHIELSSGLRGPVLFVLVAARRADAEQLPRP